MWKARCWCSAEVLGHWPILSEVKLTLIGVSIWLPLKVKKLIAITIKVPLITQLRYKTKKPFKKGLH